MTVAGIRQRAHLGWAHRLLAAGAAALVLLLAILAVNPSLHARLHADAGQADHECVITLFQQGVIPETAALVLVVAPLIPVVFAAARPSLCLAPARCRLPPGRAPPAR
jgi:hypothetical protein